MADKEHIEILNGGHRVWNEWRKSHKSIIPDLSQTTISGRLVARLNLFNANLSHVDHLSHDIDVRQSG